MDPVRATRGVRAQRGPSRELGAFVVAQLVGATLAAPLLLVIWLGAPSDLGATQPSIAVGRALVTEVVVTALLMLVIMSVATDTRAVEAPRALATAAAVGLTALAFRALTGALLNTARPFGPAFASGQWEDVWATSSAPTGSPLGALAHQFVRGKHPAAPGRGACHEARTDGALPPRGGGRRTPTPRGLFAISERIRQGVVS